MENYIIKNLNFTYPSRKEKALENINLTINSGEFICICGTSGCGKTTLLRHLKSVLAPHGNISGEILFNHRPLAEMQCAEQAARIGFVMQDVDGQLVTDKVWHELAFGLESLGIPTAEIRTRVSEMAEFFGISDWFYKNVNELSGGQKQLMNLASVMVMQPEVLILDEPTSQLDPIASGEFIKNLEKINRELGTTIIISEHRLEELFAVVGRVIVMDNGGIIADASPCRVGSVLQELNHRMLSALPTPMRVYNAVSGGKAVPVSVRDGRAWLSDFAENNTVYPERIKHCSKNNDSDICISAKEMWFRYEKNTPDVIKGLSVEIKKGEFYAIVGGNGVGKSTALSVLSGISKPYRGKLRISGNTAMLPQNPQTLLTKNTVYKDLHTMTADETAIAEVVSLCALSDLLDRNPYDLSGGEVQRAALAKVLLTAPDILMLDEPTKGLDAHFKDKLAYMLKRLTDSGVCVVIVSHDIEFCAKYADRCSMFFDGQVTATRTPAELFGANSFYTTSASRMSRGILPEAVTDEDIILACGKDCVQEEYIPKSFAMPEKPVKENNSEKKHFPIRNFIGAVFSVLFALVCVLQLKLMLFGTDLFTVISAILCVCVVACFFPYKRKTASMLKSTPKQHNKLTALAMLFTLLAVPVTLFVGIHYFGDRRYYFISLLIILEIFLPFCAAFEGKKPQAKELVILSVIIAIAVVSRMAFYMTPLFKPMTAVIMLAGIAFGAESGFLVGAMSAFVSNMFFGQGPWTPWQMLCWGLMGFLAGILFRRGIIKTGRIALCIFGFFAVLVVYGPIANVGSAFMMQPEPVPAMILSSCVMGFPFDAIHGASTAFFMWFIGIPMLEKLDRVKQKYGIGQL